MKTNRRPLLQRIPLYPIALMLYPILFVYSENLALVLDVEVLLVIAAALVVTLVVWAVSQFLLKDWYRSAGVTSVGLLLFFTYGHIANALSASQFRVGDRVLVAALAIVAVGLVVLILRQTPARLRNVTLILNVVTLALLIMPIVRVTQYHVRRQMVASAGATAVDTQERIRVDNSPDRPDIYYIILDGYSANAYLMRQWGYDNSDFTDALEQRGFFVAYDSTSNYGTTLASLPSSLNMRYLDPAEQQPTPEEDVSYLRSLIADSTVAADLQQLGYTYVDVLSGFSNDSTIADVNIDIYPDGARYFSAAQGERAACASAETCHQSPFIPFFLRTTLALPFLETEAGQDWLQSLERETPWNEDQPLIWADPVRLLALWDEAEKIARMPEATFTFLHIIKPHLTIAFDEAGTIQEDWWKWPDLHEELVEPFLAQLRFVNQRTLDMLDQILAQSSEPPIIIIQGDHGTRAGHVWNASMTHVVYFEIMNAFHFPNAGDNPVPRDITPVNSFRILFNTYFGGDYDLLENHHFDIPQGQDNFFNMVEVDLQEVLDHPERYR